ncbi:MAG: hypothetical protein E3J60_01250 [Dehalococcoidia bacterium]|nr:MAG: hypothetical protein E3J60_01250 [Dehalococcoidia bacterium]
MTQEMEDSIIARDGESSDVKQSRGRRSKAYYQADVQEVLSQGAKVAARMLQDHLDQKKGRKTLKSSLQRACEFVIDHAIGKARQKVEHSGGIMTYGELAKSADNLDAKPRPILAEVLEIAQKYQADNPGPAGDNPAPGPEVKPDETGPNTT